MTFTLAAASAGECRDHVLPRGEVITAQDEREVPASVRVILISPHSGVQGPCSRGSVGAEVADHVARHRVTVL